MKKKTMFHPIFFFSLFITSQIFLILFIYPLFYHVMSHIGGFIQKYEHFCKGSDSERVDNSRNMDC